MPENTERPLMVSIRCLTYNHEPYIRQCLEGFVMQKTNFLYFLAVNNIVYEADRSFSCFHG